MERVRQDVLFAWNKARVNIGPIPRDQNRKILKHLQTCFSSRDNPAGQRGPNERFQQELDELIESNREYYATPSIDHLWLSLCTNGKSSANSTNHDMQDWEHLPLPVRPHLLVFLGSNHDESLQSRIDMLKVRTRMLRNSLVRGVIAISRRTQTSSRKAHGLAVRQSVQ